MKTIPVHFGFILFLVSLCFLSSCEKDPPIINDPDTTIIDDTDSTETSFPDSTAQELNLLDIFTDSSNTFQTSSIAEQLIQKLADRYFVDQYSSTGDWSYNFVDTFAYVDSFYIINDSLLVQVSHPFVTYTINDPDQTFFISQDFGAYGAIQFNQDYSSFTYSYNQLYTFHSNIGSATVQPLSNFNSFLAQQGTYQLEIHEKSNSIDTVYIDTLSLSCTEPSWLINWFTLVLGNSTYSSNRYSETPSYHSHRDNSINSSFDIDYYRRVHLRNDSLYLYHYDRIDSSSIEYVGTKLW